MKLNMGGGFPGQRGVAEGPHNLQGSPPEADLTGVPPASRKTPLSTPPAGDMAPGAPHQRSSPGSGRWGVPRWSGSKGKGSLPLSLPVYPGFQQVGGRGKFALRGCWEQSQAETGHPKLRDTFPGLQASGWVSLPQAAGRPLAALGEETELPAWRTSRLPPRAPATVEVACY